MVDVLKALLLENLHPLARTCSTEAGVEVDTHAGAMDPSELVAALRRRPPARHPVQDRGHAGGARRRARPAGRRRLLHRHEPGRPRSRRRRAASRSSTPRSPTPASVVELAIAEIIVMARRLTEKDRALHDGCVGQVGHRQPRDPRPATRHRGLRQHRQPAVGGRRGARHAGVLLRHRRQARARQRPPLLVARRAARGGRGGHAARRRPRGQRRVLRRRAVRADAPTQRCSSTCRAGSSSTTTRCAQHRVSGHIAGAAVDVFPDEPKAKGDAVRLPAAGLPERGAHAAHRRVHRGGAGGHRPVRGHQAARLRRARGARRCSVNLPGLALEPHPGQHRIAHLHRNTPGVLATVNSDPGRARREHRGSAAGDVAATIGYVVTDVASSCRRTSARRAAGDARDGAAARHRLRCTRASSAW